MHIGLNTPEMRALKDLNTFGLANMSLHRHAELNSLLSEDFKNAIEENNIKFITYRDVIRSIGLENMIRPEID